jgi:hypothetical protein
MQTFGHGQADSNEEEQVEIKLERIEYELSERQWSKAKDHRL